MLFSRKEQENSLEGRNRLLQSKRRNKRQLLLFLPEGRKSK